MAVHDGTDVCPNDTPHGCGGSLWDSVTRGVWLLLGVMGLCVAGLSAIALLDAIDRKAWAVIKPLSGMVFLGLGGSYLAFKHAFRSFPANAGDGRGGRDGRTGYLVPFAGGLGVTEEEIEALAARTGRALGFWASQLTTLSPSMARKLIEQSPPFSLDLSGLQSLTKESAEVLAECSGPLVLSGLQTISCDVAEALSHHHGWLFLDGLTDLSPAVAEQLARHRHTVHLGRFYNCLSLNGVRMLSEETATSLARFLGNLRLNGLETVSPEVAQALATHAADSHWGVAELYSLLLDGVTSLPDESVVALANYTGGLSLDGLERLSPQALQALAHHRGNALSLGRLVAMPDEAAALFGSRNTRLFLPSLREISPAGRELLMRNPNVIVTDGESVDAR